jgi:tripartite-type tricarboxylate transporter receptor subunit TctC
VTVFVGFSPGGAYDGSARVLARYMGKYIPGNPNFVVQNMPGAGTLNLVNHLYNVSPKDGTNFGIFARGMAMEPLIGSSDARFDATKLTWIGSTTNEVSLCATYGTSPVKNWADTLTKNFAVAGNGSGSDPDVFANVLRNLFGQKNRLITGFPGSAEISLAMERGEVDGRCGITWDTLQSMKPDWIKDGKVRILLQFALERHPDLPTVPSVFDLATTDEQRQILTVWAAPNKMGRPFFGPPGMDKDRLTLLRRSFDATMKDPAMLHEVAQTRLWVKPITGEAVDALLKQVYATPKAVVEKAAEAAK